MEMKARIGGQTTFDSLSPSLREAVEKAAQHRAEERWAEIQCDVSRRFLCIMALSLNDVYGFGTARIQRVIDAMNEIAAGYSDDSYTPAEKREGTKDLKRMADIMQEEMESRGLFV